MGQVLIPDVPDETIAGFEQKAEIDVRTLEAELRDLMERNRPLTCDERVALSRSFRGRHDSIQPSLSLEDIREGLK